MGADLFMPQLKQSNKSAPFFPFSEFTERKLLSYNIPFSMQEASLFPTPDATSF